MRRPKVGEAPISYSELFRVVGQYVDQAGLIEVRIIETDDGLILQGLLPHGVREGERETFQLTPEDILALVEDAQAMRGNKR